MNVSEAIRTKRAVRVFTDQPVLEDVMNAILDAGRRSQSSKNTQPWQFVVVRDRATLEALSKAGDYAQHMAGAAFAVVLVGAKDTWWNAFDLGQVSSYIQLAAWELGVGSCIAAFHRPEQARAVLGIPAEMTVCAISFGYPSPDFVPAKMGGRRSLEDVVRWERWE
jgi:nitroreductase